MNPQKVGSWAVDVLVMCSAPTSDWCAELHSGTAHFFSSSCQVHFARNTEGIYIVPAELLQSTLRKKVQFAGWHSVLRIEVHTSGIRWRNCFWRPVILCSVRQKCNWENYRKEFVTEKKIARLKTVVFFSQLELEYIPSEVENKILTHTSDCLKIVPFWNSCIVHCTTSGTCELNFSTTVKVGWQGENFVPVLKVLFFVFEYFSKLILIHVQIKVQGGIKSQLSHKQGWRGTSPL